ncbi:MAG: glycoside hydrolase, partial [Chloroflexi bacterium]
MLERVHLVFKTHLDIGFTDFAAKVVTRYFTHFIPTAIHTAKVLRERDAPERFIWTTGSWLIYEYLEQASSSEKTRLEQAILAGDIAWHGLSFTTHSELMDASLFEFDLHLSQELDRRFGKHTIAAKMTDVPGHTRAIVPLLAQAGIKFLHIGVNPGSTNPDVPSAFVWKDANGAE